MVETQLAFKRQTAFRLMTIVADARLTNVAHAQLLPPSWYTLYELTKLEDAQFDHGIEAEIIRPDMERKHVTQLRHWGVESATKPAVWPDGTYPVIYTDPPWQYEHPPIGASNRSIENHYPTMSLDEICALPGLAEHVPENAVLFLWATAPKLAECFEVIDAWGFTYRTCMVWVKDKIGMGYHARNQHEVLLIAKRGQFAPPEPADRPPSVVNAPRGEHSAKPEVFYELIERMYPDKPWLEVFARNQRPGWATYGNQLEAA